MKKIIISILNPDNILYHITFVFILIGLIINHRENKKNKWKKIPGKIISSNKLPSKMNFTPSIETFAYLLGLNDKRFDIIIEYEYFINNRRYCGKSKLNFENRKLLENDADLKLLNEFSKEKSIDVIYNPNKPKVSSLFNINNIWGIRIIIYSIIFLITVILKK